MNLVFGQRERKEIEARTKRAMEENKLEIQNELTNEEIKDLGKKCFAINKIEEIDIIEKIVNL